MITLQSTISKTNLVRYKGKAPSVEKVRQCITLSGLSRNKFELVYNIVPKTIQRYEQGLRNLPVKYWHLFYEFNNLEKFYSTFIVKLKRAKKAVDKITPASPPPISDNIKAIIDAYKQRIS